MKKNVKNVLAGVSAMAVLASFSPDAQQVNELPAENPQYCLVDNSIVSVDDNGETLMYSSLFTAEGYTLLNYYYGGGLAAQLAGTYASATQGAMWGLVYGGAVGFGVGLAVGV